MAVSPLRSRRAVAQAAVGPHGVVVAAPRLDQHADLGEAAEDFAVQELVSERAVEALAVAVPHGEPGAM